MGTFNVEIEVGDPDGKWFERINALANSRTPYAVLPSVLLADLGVKPHRTMTFKLADGSRIERGFAQTWVRVNGAEGIAPVVFGDDGAVPTIGHVTLAAIRLEIDEANGRIVPIRARL